ncbi:MAG: response regulator, partial [Lachnospiraceae bacterium]
MANILAVDDEQDILKMIQRILSRDGHNVDIISNPEIISSTNLECYDIIILDVMMPQTDGFTLCQQVRRRTGCPVVFLTAKSDEESLVYGLGMGADDYILKPFGT